jgi:hypothetical protein
MSVQRRGCLTGNYLSAPAIALESGYSLRQVKRAMKEMLANNEVTFTGQMKAKAWSLNPCHTVELLGEEGMRSRHVTTFLQPLTRAHVVSRVPILWSRDWETPKGCPTNTCSTAGTKITTGVEGLPGEPPSSFGGRLSTVCCEKPPLANTAAIQPLTDGQIAPAEPERTSLGARTADFQCARHPGSFKSASQSARFNQPRDLTVDDTGISDEELARYLAEAA